jgi:hypothetical protein
MFQEILDHPAYDSFWKSISVRERLDKVQIPVLAFGGWYDNFVENDLEAFRRLRALSRPARLVVGPWAHDMNYKFPAFDFGQNASVTVRRFQVQWFDYWLKPPGPGSAGSTPGPPLRIFVMGVNRWRDEREWPLARARDTAFYFSSGGGANGLGGDGKLQAKLPGRSAPDRFTYDPLKPVPTMGGAVCCDPKIFPWGPMDQRPVEKRRDVLVYSGSPLKQDLEVTGVIRVTLWASTTASDTDFTAKLVDVFPDGRAVNLADGILRLRYRDSLERPTLAAPDRAYALSIDAGVTSNVFLKGHRIRVEISSSNFPRFDRNPNTGGPLASETRLRPAAQTIYHDAQHPSRIILPVVP